jgi:hypothetical protein
MSANIIFPATVARLTEWQANPDVLGVLLVGSKSRGYNDELSDDDLEVLLTDEASARLMPAQCHELHFEGEGASRKIIYDAQYTTLTDLQCKAHSPVDLDHWPYERAQALFDRDGHTSEAVKAAGNMDASFRRLRLQHATIEAWIAPRRAQKTFKRGFEAAGRMLVARSAKALTRILFALAWHWVPLDHWLELELRTLADPMHAGASILEAMTTGRPEPLLDALARLEDTLAAEGVARPKERIALFLELIHPSRATERAIHGLP